MCPGSTMSRRRLTSTFGSPGAGSTTTVRSSTAVTQTRRPSTSAAKSGRISSSSSISTLSRRTSSIWLLCRLTPGFRFESMLISQIPDQEQDQTQRQPWNQVCRENQKGFSDTRTHAAAQFEEDRGPDQSGHEYARCKNSIRDPKYSRKGRQHNSHAGNVAADDDRPWSPSPEDPLSADEPLVGHADVPPESRDERPAEAPADGEVARASQHRSADDCQVGKGIRDGACRGQVSAVGDGDVARRRQRHAQLFQED